MVGHLWQLFQPIRLYQPARYARTMTRVRKPAMLGSQISKNNIKEDKVNPKLIVEEIETPGIEVHENDKIASGFSHFGLREDILKALSSFNIVTPTPIQKLAIPQIMKGKNCMLAAETGSGKTIAYLAPILNAIKNEEENDGVVRKQSNPRVIVLLPTRELVQQVLKVVKSFSHVIKLRARSLLGGTNKVVEKKELQGELDLIVSTPKRLLRHRETDTIFLSDVRFVVFDEADTLFEEGFIEDLRPIIGAVKRKETEDRKNQFISVSATLPKHVVKTIDSFFPDIKHITTPLLHRPLPKLSHRFVKVQGTGKQSQLIQVLKDSNAQKTLIFCNRIQSCETLYNFLKSKQYKIVFLHKYMTPEERTESFERFTSGNTNLLVTTDIASRGLDTTMVDHVILYDFPKNGVDYLHRVGRTGRGTAKGIVTSLISKRDGQMAERIQRAIRERKSLGWTPNEKVFEDIVNMNDDEEEESEDGKKKSTTTTKRKEREVPKLKTSFNKNESWKQKPKSNRL